jgi:hypothetical protein
VMRTLSSKRVAVWHESRSTLAAFAVGLPVNLTLLVILYFVVLPGNTLSSAGRVREGS